jgi:hypothetical protein
LQRQKKPGFCKDLSSSIDVCTSVFIRLLLSSSECIGKSRQRAGTTGSRKAIFFYGSSLSEILKEFGNDIPKANF